MNSLKSLCSFAKGLSVALNECEKDVHAFGRRQRGIVFEVSLVSLVEAAKDPRVRLHNGSVALDGCNSTPSSIDSVHIVTGRKWHWTASTRSKATTGSHTMSSEARRWLQIGERLRLQRTMVERTQTKLEAFAHDVERIAQLSGMTLEIQHQLGQRK